jgi:TRAP-type transport system periplasmic protein
MRFSTTLGASVALSCCAACGGGDSGKIVVKVAWVLPDGHPSSSALELFELRAEEFAGGELDVQLFANGTLGDATECAEGLRVGNLEMAVLSAAPLSQFATEMNVLTMPFLFDDPEHQHAVVDSELGSRIGASLEDAGMHCLGFFDAGSRNVMTVKGPIEEPEDLQGLRIRVMASKLMVDTLNAMGASAQAMGQGEVYSALQTGVLDGWENNPPTALTFKMYETGCTHFAWTRHLAVPDLVVAGKDFFEALDPKIRSAIERAIDETIARQRVLWREGEERAVAELKSAGMVFNEVDREAFAGRVESVYAEYFAKHGETFEQLCEEIRSMR